MSNHDTALFAAGPSLASVGIDIPFASLLSRKQCYLIVNDRSKSEDEINWNFVVKVDRGSTSVGRRMSTSCRSIQVTRDTILKLVRAWKESNYHEVTGGSSSGPQGRRNSVFFDGKSVDAEMKAWIGTGVPPSLGSMIRFLAWRLKLSREEPGGLVFSDVQSVVWDPEKKLLMQPPPGVKLELKQEEAKNINTNNKIRRGSIVISYDDGGAAGGQEEEREEEGGEEEPFNNVPFSKNINIYDEDEESTPINCVPCGGGRGRLDTPYDIENEKPPPRQKSSLYEQPICELISSTEAAPKPTISGKFPPRRHSISLARTDGAFVEGGYKLKVMKPENDHHHDIDLKQDENPFKVHHIPVAGVISPLLPHQKSPSYNS